MSATGVGLQATYSFRGERVHAFESFPSAVEASNEYATSETANHAFRGVMDFGVPIPQLKSAGPYAALVTAVKVRAAVNSGRKSGRAGWAKRAGGGDREPRRTARRFSRTKSRDPCRRECWTRSSRNERAEIHGAESIFKRQSSLLQQTGWRMDTVHAAQGPGGGGSCIARVRVAPRGQRQILELAIRPHVRPRALLVATLGQLRRRRPRVENLLEARCRRRRVDAQLTPAVTACTSGAKLCDQRLRRRFRRATNVFGLCALRAEPRHVSWWNHNEIRATSVKETRLALANNETWRAFKTYFRWKAAGQPSQQMSSPASPQR